MAKTRLVQLRSAKSINTADTETIDINLSKPITNFVIETKCTNNGATPTAHGAAVVSKIELVDGSDVLFSLTGHETQALNFYEKGHMPFQVNEYRNDVMNIQTFEINFGRVMWDKDLALDPRRFNNLQLKITHNKALGGSSPDAGTLSVFANVFDNMPVTPRGFLMSKEIKQYPLVASAHEYTDLPTDYRIRKLFIQSYAADLQPWQQYNKVKLHVDDGASVLIDDVSTSDLLKLYMPDRRIVESVLGTGTGSAVTHYLAASYDVYGSLTGFDTATTTNFAQQSYGGTVDIGFDNAEHFQSVFQGLAPHGTMEIPFGVQNMMDDWLEVSLIKSLKLDITAGSSASGTVQIFLQQMRTY